MKVLLLNPHKAFCITEPPLGLAYLAAMIEKDHEVRIIDATVEGLSLEQTLKEVCNYAPDVIGITMLTPVYPRAKELCLAIKKSLNTFVIGGGVHCTLMPEETLRDTGIDLVVTGEGELTFKELINILSQGKSIEDVKGIAYLKDGKFIKTDRRPFMENLDTLPYPARHLLPLRKYTGSQGARGSVTTAVMTSRGCPFDCLFCSVKATWTRKFRQRSPENVVGEFVEIYNKFGIKEISFNDDLLTTNRKWLVKFCEGLKATKIDFSWRCLSRTDTIDRDLLRLMKEAGCHTIAFGVESGNQEVIDTIKKKINLAEVKDIFNLVKEVGIDIWAFFMLGNLGENRSTIRDTMNLAKELNPDTVSFSIAMPIPGSDFYSIAVEKNMMPSDFDWSQFDYNHDALIGTEDMSREELKNLRGKMYEEFYDRLFYIYENIIKKSIKQRSLEGIPEKIKFIQLYVPRMSVAKGIAILLGKMFLPSRAGTS